MMHALTGNGDSNVNTCQNPILPPGITAPTVSNGTRMSPALAITANSIADVCIKFECLGASNESSTPRAIREHLRLASDEERHAFKVLGRMKHSRRTILPDVSMPKRHQRKKAMPNKRAIPYMNHKQWNKFMHALHGNGMTNPAIIDTSDESTIESDAKNVTTYVTSWETSNLSDARGMSGLPEGVPKVSLLNDSGHIDSGFDHDVLYFDRHPGIPKIHDAMLSRILSKDTTISAAKAELWAEATSMCFVVKKVSELWHISHKKWNKEMHALHGNTSMIRRKYTDGLPVLPKKGADAEAFISWMIDLRGFCAMEAHRTEN